MDTILAKDRELHMKLPQGNMITSHHKGPLIPQEKKKKKKKISFYTTYTIQ